MKEYDENEAIDFIRKHIGEERSKRYTDDDILELIDLSFDFFEQFSEDDDLDIEITLDGERMILEGEDAEALFDYVRHLTAKDKNSHIRQEDIPDILTGEILYEETLS